MRFLTTFYFPSSASSLNITPSSVTLYPILTCLPVFPALQNVCHTLLPFFQSFDPCIHCDYHATNLSFFPRKRQTWSSAAGWLHPFCHPSFSLLLLIRSAPDASFDPVRNCATLLSVVLPSSVSLFLLLLSFRAIRLFTMLCLLLVSQALWLAPWEVNSTFICFLLSFSLGLVQTKYGLSGIDLVFCFILGVRAL